MYCCKKTCFKSKPITIVKNQPQIRAFDAIDGDFVINAYGHIRSDFATLVDSNDANEMARALQSMQASFAENSHLYDGMTFEEIVKTIRPRWCQFPGEVDRFEQYLIDEALDFYKELRDASKNEDDYEEKPATLSAEQPAEGE